MASDVDEGTEAVDTSTGIVKALALDLETVTDDAHSANTLRALAAERDTLRAEVGRLRGLLKRYRTETPLGHQPHMIAHEVDTELAAQEPQS